MFYNTRNLTVEQRRDIIYRAKEKCDSWWVDVLDCKKSALRQQIKMSFEDIMTRFNQRCHFSIIHRNHDPENYLEIAFSTLDGRKNYFLWLHLDPKYLEEFTKGLKNV